MKSLLPWRCVCSWVPLRSLFFPQWEGMSHKPYGVFRSYVSKKEWAGTGYRIVKPGAEAWGPFLESPVVFYRQDRGFNSFACNMIKLSVNETKWSILLARTRALILFISIWFRTRKVIETLEKRPLAPSSSFRRHWRVISRDGRPEEEEKASHKIIFLWDTMHIISRNSRKLGFTWENCCVNFM